MAEFTYGASRAFRDVTHKPILDFIEEKIQRTDCLGGNWRFHKALELALLKACLPLQLCYHGKLIHANTQADSVRAVAQLIKAMREAKFSTPARIAQKTTLACEYDEFKGRMGYRRFEEEMYMLRTEASNMDKITAIEVGQFVQALISDRAKPRGVKMV